MAFGFPASFQVERDLAGSRQNARSAIIHAFDVLRWPYEMEDKDTFRVSLSANVLSWGENVSVSIEPGIVRIKSICKLPTQVFDWGKNKQNVKQFLTYFEPSEIRNQQLASERDFIDETGNTPLERALNENDE
jgi:hypothetical protein